MNNHFFPEKGMSPNEAIKLKQTAIYQYVQLPHLLSNLKNKQLWFRNIIQWSDPYENFFLKQNFFSDRYQQTLYHNLLNQNFGQCWTTIPESELMWRGNKKCQSITIKIKSTVYDILNIILKSDIANGSYYCGNIKYTNINKWLKENNTINLANFHELIAESVFLKRPEFKSEREFRFLINECIDSEIITNPKDFLIVNYTNNPFYEYIIDPTIEEEYIISAIKKEIISADNSIKINSIKKSELHQIKTNTISIL